MFATFFFAIHARSSPAKSPHTWWIYRWKYILAHFFSCRKQIVRRGRQLEKMCVEREKSNRLAAFRTSYHWKRNKVSKRHLRALEINKFLKFLLLEMMMRKYYPAGSSNHIWTSPSIRVQVQKHLISYESTNETWSKRQQQDKKSLKILSCVLQLQQINDRACLFFGSSS